MRKLIGCFCLAVAISLMVLTAGCAKGNAGTCNGCPKAKMSQGCCKGQMKSKCGKAKACSKANKMKEGCTGTPRCSMNAEDTPACPMAK